MAHDQLFKELLRAFLPDFMRLFYPDVAARLNWAEATFPNVEVFTDVPEGSVRRADTIAIVPTWDGEPELVLIHVETQSERRSIVRFRMFEYYVLLRLRYKVPVFPVVLYIVPGTGGITYETYVESLFEKNILTFEYAAVGLPELKAEDYLENDNPLAPALSALMQPPALGRAAQKLASLQQVISSGVDEARQVLLTNLIETYLTLNAEEETEYESLVSQSEETEDAEMVDLFEERVMRRGVRNMLLKQMRIKFGELPEQIEVRIRSISDQAALETLSERFVTAETLADMKLEEA